MDDDGLTDSELYVYVGGKQNTGNAVERAGLHGGNLYAVRVLGAGAPQVEDANTGFGANVRNFSLVNLGDVSAKDGNQLESDSLVAGASMFRRVEDGAWDTKNPNVFYFVTTADFNTKSRLWKLTFKNAGKPELGGTIKLLLDGGDGSNTVKMLDNMTVAADGNLILQEDPGNQTYLAKIWSFNVKTRLLTELATHDGVRFDGTDGTVSDGTADDYHTQDEESSGVIEATGLFEGVTGYDTREYRYFLVAVQAHKAYHPVWTPDEKTEYVEGGQLLLMRVAR
jgi:secreted PhoX family phosphatase